MNEKIKLKPGQVDEIANAEKRIRALFNSNVSSEEELEPDQIDIEWKDNILEVNKNPVLSIHLQIHGTEAIAIVNCVRKELGITSYQNVAKLALYELARKTLKERRGENGKLARMAH